MYITVKLYPPLMFPDGADCHQIEVEKDCSVDKLLQYLEDKGAFSQYGRQGVFAMTDNDVALPDYILKAGQEVKILLRPAGG